MTGVQTCALPILSEKRIFPAIDIKKSGTRKEELLLSKNELNTIYVLRKSISNISNTEATEQLINIITSTKNNNEFLSKIEYFFKNK